MSQLRAEFRLHYGEGKGKKVEAAFNLFRLGYECGLKKAANKFDIYGVEDLCAIQVAQIIREMAKELG